MTYQVKRGFGALRVKEYFVVEKDGDSLSGVIAGPFESREQCFEAIEALRPMYYRPIVCIAGHLSETNQSI
jgi:hypothetical protein